MSKHVYSVTEIVGTSSNGVQEAIENAVTEAAKDLNHLEWFSLTEIRGHVEAGRIAHYQVGLKIGARISSDGQR